MKEKQDFLGFGDKKYRPIVRERSMDILFDLVAQNKPKHVLEIGTFIGYSAAKMLQAGAEFVTTIEIDEQNAHDAEKNLSEEFAGRFEVKNMDAIDFCRENSDKNFDFIFLDGPKGQYIKYLPYLKKMLNVGGYLVADDVLFYNLVLSNEKVKHKHRTIVTNLRAFLDDLKNDENFETELFQIENGLLVSKKRK